MLGKIFLLNLKERKDRLDYSLDVLSKQGFNNIEVFETLNSYKLNISHPTIPIGRIGCDISRIFLYRELLRRKLDRVTIFEDDVTFLCDFRKVIFSIKDYFPPDFGVINYGCWDKCTKLSKPFNNMFYIPGLGILAHAWTINCKYLSQMIDSINLSVTSDEAVFRSGIPYYATKEILVEQNHQIYGSNGETPP